MSVVQVRAATALRAGHAVARSNHMRALVILALLCSTAHADDDGPKDPAVATSLSLAATAASYATVGLSTLALDSKYGKVAFATGITGMWLAPSLGRAYAEQYDASGAFVVRFLALPAAALGLLIAHAETEDGGGHPWGTGVLVGAGAMFVGGTVWELVTVGDAARRFNRRWRDPPALSIAPTASGFVVGGAF